jgi:hypothetical protein
VGLKAISPVICGLAARGYVRAPVEQLPTLRRCPCPAAPDALPSTFLKHSDEQTVCGLAAVFQAIHEHQLGDTDFSNWGVLAGPLFLGRNTVGAALARFAAEGAWGVSPHLIPHRSLHSLSGTVSHALKIHGPNYGVGGGPGAVSEALLNAAALLHGQRLPGVWLVLTQMDPELPPIPSGQPVPGTSGVALALALVPWLAGSSLPRLRFLVDAEGRQAASGNGLPGCERVSVDALHLRLETSRSERVPLALELEHGGRLEIEYATERISEAATRLLAPGSVYLTR